LKPLFVLSVLVFAPSVSAYSLDVGPLGLSVVREEPGRCAVDLEPCPGWHDPGPTGEVGDDEVTLYQAIDRVELEVRTSAASHRVDVNLAESSVPHPLWRSYTEVDREFDALTPSLEEVHDVDVDEGGIHRTGPTYDEQNAEVEPYSATLLWEPEFYNYTHLHVPYTTYTRSTDYFVQERPIYYKSCPSPWLLGDKACDVRQVHGAWPVIRNLTPNVRFGGEVHQVGVLLQSSADAPGGVFAADLGVHGSVQGDGVLLTRSSDSRLSVLHDEPSPPTPLNPGLNPSPHASTSPALAGASAVPPVAQDTSLLLAAGLAAGLLLALALYHRLLGERVLDHPQRKSIRAFVAANPGCDVASIAAHVGLDYKTARHHLEVLARAKLLRINQAGPRRTMVHLEGQAAEALHAHALRHTTRQRLLWAVQSSPGVRQAALAREFGIGRSTLHAHVRTMCRTGLLENRRGRLYAVEGARPTPSLAPAAPVAP
jgi:DNA-binding transcriptional ArsR family regulator